MEMRSSVRHQSLKAVEVIANGSVFFKRFDDCGTDVGAAANGWRVAERSCGFLDRCDDHSLHTAFVIWVFASPPRQRTSAKQRARPGAKVFGAEMAAPHVLNVSIDGLRLNIDELAITVLIFEDAPVLSFQQCAQQATYLFVFKLGRVHDAGLATELKGDGVASDVDMTRSQSRNAVATVF